MNDEVFNLCLLDMRDTIISKGFPFDECLVVAMAHDHLADSSQDVLHSIEMPLGMSGFPIGNFATDLTTVGAKGSKTSTITTL